ncbi:unnamed protein product [Calypogeia fissa]
MAGGNVDGFTRCYDKHYGVTATFNHRLSNTLSTAVEQDNQTRIPSAAVSFLPEMVLNSNEDCLRNLCKPFNQYRQRMITEERKIPLVKITG